MSKHRAIEILNEEIDLWWRILHHFEESSRWFKEGQEKIEAYRMAVAALEEEDKIEGL